MLGLLNETCDIVSRTATKNSANQVTGNSDTTVHSGLKCRLDDHYYEGIEDFTNGVNRENKIAKLFTEYKTDITAEMIAVVDSINWQIISVTPVKDAIIGHHCELKIEKIVKG